MSHDENQESQLYEGQTSTSAVTLAMKTENGQTGTFSLEHSPKVGNFVRKELMHSPPPSLLSYGMWTRKVKSSNCCSPQLQVSHSCLEHTYKVQPAARDKKPHVQMSLESTHHSYGRAASDGNRQQ